MKKSIAAYPFILCFTLFVAAGVISKESFGGVFNSSHFVSPGSFAVGIEPELILTNGAGFGANARYTQGMSDLMNIQGIIGTGGGHRNFRVGGNLTFDFFPDIEGQPGIGVGFQSLYYRIKSSGQLELTAFPYVHKTFTNTAGEFEPFVSIPVGFAFDSGTYRAISTISFGSLFKASEKFRYVVEIGIAINNSDSYASGGVTYYH